MKKFVNKFFGIDEHGMNGAPGIAYRYTPRRSNCGWDILCQFIRDLLFVGNEATIVLMVLKLIGSITIGWEIVLLPAVIRAVFEVIENAMNSRISKISDQLREAYYAEQIKRYKATDIPSMHPNSITTEHQLFDEEDELEDDEEELYELK